MSPWKTSGLSVNEGSSARPAARSAPLVPYLLASPVAKYMRTIADSTLQCCQRWIPHFQALATGKHSRVSTPCPVCPPVDWQPRGGARQHQYALFPPEKVQHTRQLTTAQLGKHFCINCPLSIEQGLSAGHRHLKLVITTAGSDLLLLLITGPHALLLKSYMALLCS